MEGGDDDLRTFILWWTVPLTLQMSHEASQAHEYEVVYEVCIEVIMKT